MTGWNFFVRVSVILVGLGFCAAAWAADEDSIQITADNMQWDEKNGTARATGNAVVEQEEKRLHADTIIAHAQRGEDGSISEIHLIEVEGNVSYETPTESAHGQRGNYDLSTGLLALTGNVLLLRGDSKISGDTLTINFETGVSEIAGNDDNRAAVTFEADSSDE